MQEKTSGLRPLRARIHGRATPLIVGLLGAIVAVTLIVQYVAQNKKTPSGDLSAEAVAARIRPVADDGYHFKQTAGAKQQQTGEAIFKTVCSACHSTGAAGAPKFGEAAAWGPRIAQGYDTLLGNALAGVRAMPAKGGNPDLSELEVARAVVYMANAGGAKFKEPEAKPAQ